MSSLCRAIVLGPQLLSAQASRTALCRSNSAFGLMVKKFCCREANCPQKIFAERLPGFLEPNSRLTTRLRVVISSIAGAFNAQGGARLGGHLGIHLSRMTSIRSLLAVSLPSVGQAHLNFSRASPKKCITQDSADVDNAKGKDSVVLQSLIPFHGSVLVTPITVGCWRIASVSCLSQRLSDSRVAVRAPGVLSTTLH